MSERKYIGTLAGQLVGRKHYEKANATPGKSYTLSRTHPKAVENEKYDTNSTVVMNDRGEVVGSLARGFAVFVAPIIDGSLASLKCTVPKAQGLGSSMALQYNTGENLDLDIDIYASNRKLPELEKIGILGKLAKKSPGGGDKALPVSPSTVPDEKRARVSDFTNLKSTLGGNFICSYVTDECEVFSEEKIRYPDAWLEEMKFPEWAEEVVIYKAAASSGEKDTEIIRKRLVRGAVAEEEGVSHKRHKH